MTKHELRQYKRLDIPYEKRRDDCPLKLVEDKEVE